MRFFLVFFLRYRYIGTTITFRLLSVSTFFAAVKRDLIVSKET